MIYEMLVGLKVIDEAMYEEYRKNMKPILAAYDGGFSNDFKISEVLLAEQTNDINRVFTIYFPDQKTNEAFFSNEEYLKVKEQYFKGAVENVTTISRYEKGLK
jgi:uncharacterized protein (DUF1330 family)